MADAYVSHSTS